MLKTYEQPYYDYIQSEEQKTGTVKRHPVVVIGCGPVGVTAGLDLAQRGVDVVVVDDNNTVSVGSRAVCYAKRPLEIWDRLGCGERMVDKGVVWNVGKVFREDDQVYQFDLLPESDHKIPAFINLQQYHLEQYLVEKGDEWDNLDIRWKTKLTGIEQNDDCVTLTLETPDGTYVTEAEYVIVCDGANSDTRRMMGLNFDGQTFNDQFLIADVVMKADFPAERWFWFNPPFHPEQSALLHMQSDDVWRLDFQLGADADPEEEKKEENIIPRVRAMLGEDADFELEWASVYQFNCRRMDSFIHDRVIFAGDAAHQVSPFGARGANTGVQDIDNLSWKLELILNGKAPASLLDSYNEERIFAADDNILNSTRSTDFISPKSDVSRVFRDAVLDLAHDYEFARPLVNSGRLSVPTPYTDSSLNTADHAEFKTDLKPGTNCKDAPVSVDGQDGWLLNQLGDGFAVLVFGDAPAESSLNIDGLSVPVYTIGKDIVDAKGLVTERYDGKPGTTYLIRPDQHIAARWRQFDANSIAGATRRAIGKA